MTIANKIYTNQHDAQGTDNDPNKTLALYHCVDNIGISYKFVPCKLSTHLSGSDENITSELEQSIIEGKYQ